MNEVLEEGKRRYEELRQTSPQFRAFIERQERAAAKSGALFTDEHRWALAVMFEDES